jgi:hypothetical protein
MCMQIYECVCIGEGDSCWKGPGRACHAGDAAGRRLARHEVALLGAAGPVPLGLLAHEFQGDRGLRQKLQWTEVQLHLLPHC